MAVEADRLLKKDSNHNNNISIAKNHIWCFCHKLALILNAGLKSIAESSESGQVDPMANPFDQDGFVDDSDSDDSEDKGPAVRELNVIEKILKKFKSRKRGYIAQNVIKKLIENEQDRQDHEGGKNHFNEYEITQSDWDIVKKLNDIISEFYYVTKKMEGDIPSASMVLAKYRLLQQYLEGKLSTINEDEFKNMINTMLKKINTYINKALACDAILLATALNPSYRLSMIQKWYPLAFPRAQAILEAKFQQRKQALNDQDARDEDTPPPKKNTTLAPGGGLEEDVNFFLDAANAETDTVSAMYLPCITIVDAAPENYDKLAAYLGGKYWLPSSQAADCLTWWKLGSFISYFKF
ncbi:uncharacterized protein PGTG_16323 [Puccinia graminis f. sp. tritici CRL 75-36-700-3]|uniref:hAT-like transposase RNase-H fold domain-containing protein n=1 Tax=Puccinia graminis f. sp. tritici (strain CRL 75-36-700-3 / race SCCL) TaxID=418459 RepID=E3L1A2_PUCGT|nr:uncharacterized protein PGTG_16323 [Puccinia graminis f. sp. tritici CRL 75-36-700-3]EFP90297.2 hypothetical protein PGTG_16323 [Puccinia graminis f. sp. tritici CRL 75-36-700-3]